mmetsp:Transcript_19708/g.40183  ORF Transcript_19708/g.40183 Transcript_19708/m.40183 type:complete len:313 (-) Transcript_19708:255-1193(-)
MSDASAASSTIVRSLSDSLTTSPNRLIARASLPLPRCSPSVLTAAARRWDGVRISWKILRKKISFDFATSRSFSRATLSRASLIFLPVSSRMKHRVCLNDPSGFQFTFESMRSSFNCPFFARKRTGTSLMVLPLPRVLKISRTSGVSSGQNCIMGCPMYSSGVYPSTFISVSFAQRTCPVPLNQCIAMGALLRKSNSSRSEGALSAFSAASSDAASDTKPDGLPDNNHLVPSRTEMAQSSLRQSGKSPFDPIARVRQLRTVGTFCHSCLSLAHPVSSFGVSSTSESSFALAAFAHTSFALAIATRNLACSSL